MRSRVGAGSANGGSGSRNQWELGGADLLLRRSAKSGEGARMDHNGHVLPARLYPKDHAQLDPGVVVEHKHLDGVFAWIAAQQRECDAVRLASPKISRREKQRICSGAPLRIPTASPT